MRLTSSHAIAAGLVGIAAAGAGAAALAGGHVRSVAQGGPPPPHARFDYQIGGAYPPAGDVATIDRDRRAQPVPGRYNICYFNGFQAQPDETAWWRRHHAGLLLKVGRRPVVDRAWREQLLDDSTPARRRALAAILGGWIDGCAKAGFQAVEPDNLDSWTRSKGRLSRADNVALAYLLIARAHADRLAIAQKNTAELGPVGRAVGFDFAIAEECGAYGECDSYTRVYADRVIEVEYPDQGGLANFRSACQARGATISITYRDRNVVPRGRPGYVEKWC